MKAKKKLIKRKDGSYSQRGLWDNIRANKGSGKNPTEEMYEQENKIKVKAKKNYKSGGKIDPPSKKKLLEGIKLKQDFENTLEVTKDNRYRIKLDAEYKSGKITKSEYEDRLARMKNAQDEMQRRRTARYTSAQKEASKGYDNIMNFINDRKK